MLELFQEGLSENSGLLKQSTINTYAEVEIEQQFCQYVFGMFNKLTDICKIATVGHLAEIWIEIFHVPFFYDFENGFSDCWFWYNFLVNFNFLSKSLIIINLNYKNSCCQIFSLRSISFTWGWHILFETIQCIEILCGWPRNKRMTKYEEMIRNRATPSLYKW